jgi:hypothetical protein
MVIVAGWITTSSLPGGVAALPPRRRDSPEALDEAFRFRLFVGWGPSVAGITRAVGEDDIKVGCWTMGVSGTGPVERRSRRVEVVGTLGAMIGVTWAGVAVGEDDWMVGMPCVLCVAKLSAPVFWIAILAWAAG